MKTLILIPAYKPEQSFVDFSRRLTERGHEVLAVDDGGGEAFAPIFEQVRAMGVTVLTHPVNRGKGRALKTAFAYITEQRNDVDCVVTADCDGQHKIEDIERIIAAMEEDSDRLVLGGRFKEKNVEIPLRSRLGNGFTRGVFFLATGMKIHDTQTGLRGIPKKLFGVLTDLEGERYEYEMNMLLYLKQWDCGYAEIPIETVYIDNNAGSHYNPWKDSMRIFGQILKFSLSSLITTVVDFLLFWILHRFVFVNDDRNLAAILGMGDGFWFRLLAAFSLAYLCARVVSATMNYCINRKLVFRSGGRHSVLRYLALSVGVMIVGSLVTGFLTDILSWPGLLCKVLVDFPLYFFNYFAQKNWVFACRKKTDSKPNKSI